MNEKEREIADTVAAVIVILGLLTLIILPFM